MAQVRKLTSDGDLSYSAGKQEVIEGTDASAQAVRVGLMTIRGENVFHPDLGLDLSVIDARTESERQAGITSAILRTGRVRRVLNIQRLNEANKARRADYAVRALLTTNEEVIINVGL